MASNVKFSRRRLIAGAASASALTIASPFIRTAHAAGSLSIGFWDHWVPGANDSLTKLCKEWEKKRRWMSKLITSLRRVANCNSPRWQRRKLNPDTTFFN